MSMDLAIFYLIALVFMGTGAGIFSYKFIKDNKK